MPVPSKGTPTFSFGVHRCLNSSKFPLRNLPSPNPQPHGLGGVALLSAARKQHPVQGGKPAHGIAQAGYGIVGLMTQADAKYVLLQEVLREALPLSCWTSTKEDMKLLNVAILPPQEKYLSENEANEN